ncbi:hypothetical protein ABZR88_02540 [Mucilaginibacter yixingensis]|uniref:hypothetical protein n=1 Tax=Mucilaginibacter yixingensis TaxID=1295612 RepID=UPI0011B1F890|nr:hypothetical protein [Mucilaginibacter yixingensis]
MLAYVNDPANGLTKNTQMDGVKISLAYRPKQLAPSWRTTVSGRPCCFLLGLSKNNKELLRQLSYNEYSDLVQILSFRISDFIALVPDGKKPVSPMTCYFLQTYGTTTANQVLIVFDERDLERCRRFKILIKEFGLNIGSLCFEFEQKDITAISTLKITS